ncbi:hypothetical protein [Microbacterium sp. NPDC096154]|uniref:hypothetical protein n=1 Tax=Microbacterium sp. NPDC096154 TaxID=3155549 RepID=UPI0033312D4D
MSQNYGAVPPSSTTDTGTSSGTTETAKHEASEVAGTAKAEAGHVVDTAKQEAKSVAHEAKTQAKQVYAQTRQELSDQAASQQQRVADGLRSIGDELQSLTRNAENRGMATEFVEQASARINDASSWLSQRDPGSLLNEVKSFARRKPGMFIAGALVAGVVAGRLTRALTENAKDEHVSGTTGDYGTTGGYGATGDYGTTGGTGYGATGATGYGATGTTGGSVGDSMTGVYGATATSGSAAQPAPGGEGAVGQFGAGSPSPAGSATTIGAGVDATGEYPEAGLDEPTPMYDQSRAANPAAETSIEQEPHDGR